MNLKSAKTGWVVYTPEFGGNRTAKLEDQMTVEVHWLTHGEKKRYERKVIPKIKGRRFTSNAAEIDKLIFVENVRNVKNLSIDKESVVDASVLWDLGPSELIEELVSVIQNYSELSEDDTKN